MYGIVGDAARCHGPLSVGAHSSTELTGSAGKIYWADPTNLGQANLDGSGRQMLVPGTNRINGLAVDAGSSQQKTKASGERRWPGALSRL